MFSKKAARFAGARWHKRGDAAEGARETKEIDKNRPQFRTGIATGFFICTG